MLASSRWHGVKKTLCSSCGHAWRNFYDRRIHRVRDLDSGGTRIYLEFEYRRVDCRRCHAVKQETLAWLAESGRFTKRFEQRVGRDCRVMTVKEVAERYRLGWDQVRRMDVAYMRELWSKHLPSLRLRAIGVDEISIRKGHSYAIVVADLDQKRPIWMSSELGRAEEDMDRFFDDMGFQRCRSLRLSVMDMWPAFRNSLERHAPKARVVFDKFHVIRHLGGCLG